MPRPRDKRSIVEIVEALERTIGTLRESLQGSQGLYELMMEQSMGEMIGKDSRALIKGLDKEIKKIIIEERGQNSNEDIEHHGRRAITIRRKRIEGQDLSNCKY
ncbi:Uncharacterised protein [Streptococcus pneumoniae]|nr:Uncharacterised protein [Streptococcus pneumoniae]